MTSLRDVSATLVETDSPVAALRLLTHREKPPGASPRGGLQHRALKDPASSPNAASCPSIHAGVLPTSPEQLPYLRRRVRGGDQRLADEDGVHGQRRQPLGGGAAGHA